MIKCEGVSYAYPDGTRALRGVDLAVGRGEFVAVVGPNGSGKTTLLKLMVGLLKPTEGSVRVLGRDTRELSASELAFKVGFVYQNPDHQLFCSTVYEECAYALRNAGLSEEEVRARVEEVLERVGLAGLEDVPPHFLSKGQRQRLAVAAVLAMRPEVVVVDEPTTGQDYEQSRYVMELLRSLHEEGRTVIVVTHNMRLVAEYAERVVVLRGGVVVADGPTREVMGNVDLLASASLAPPPVTALTLELFGVPALTVAEAVALVGGRA